MKSKQRFATALILFLSTSVMACAAGAAQAGRYIVYLDASRVAEMKDPKEQSALLTRWGNALQGKIEVERQLATGGWVLKVTSPGSSTHQQQTLQRLPGVESVEPDALMRHQ